MQVSFPTRGEELIPLPRVAIAALLAARAGSTYRPILPARLNAARRDDLARPELVAVAALLVTRSVLVLPAGLDAARRDYLARPELVLVTALGASRAAASHGALLPAPVVIVSGAQLSLRIHDALPTRMVVVHIDNIHTVVRKRLDASKSVMRRSSNNPKSVNDAFEVINAALKSLPPAAPRSSWTTTNWHLFFGFFSSLTQSQILSLGSYPLTL